MYIVIEPGDTPADLELWLSYLEDLANGLKGAQGQIIDDVTEGALDATESLSLDGEAPDEWYGYPYWP